MSKKILSSFMFIFCLSLLTGCYRMPSENEYSLVPTTNNPAVTYEKNDNLMPSVKY